MSEKATISDAVGRDLRRMKWKCIRTDHGPCADQGHRRTDGEHGQRRQSRFRKDGELTAPTKPFPWPRYPCARPASVDRTDLKMGRWNNKDRIALSGSSGGWRRSRPGQLRSLKPAREGGGRERGQRWNERRKGNRQHQEATTGPGAIGTGDPELDARHVSMGSWNLPVTGINVIEIPE
jgi:hypothetical protein